MGLSVCYDLRFPELYRQLAPTSSWCHRPSPTPPDRRTGSCCCARAIENQAYVIASAQGGLHENGRQTWGQTMVVDPWGQILGQHATGAGVVVCDIDPARLQSVRQQLPALQHRRL